MKLNEIRAKRAELITQAQAIIETAEAENRDLTTDEMAAVDALIGVEDGSVPNQVTQLDAQIARYVRVETLTAELSQPADGQEREKPEPGQKKAMKRAEFAKLDPVAQGEYVKGGGKVED